VRREPPVTWQGNDECRHNPAEKRDAGEKEKQEKRQAESRDMERVAYMITTLRVAGDGVWRARTATKKTVNDE